MSDKPIFNMRRVPVLDTGIGIEAGYASDEELIAAAKAQRTALPSHLRECMNKVDARLEAAILGIRYEL